MLDPDKIPREFFDNLKALMKAGYRSPEGKECDNLPLEGANTFLINDQGDIKVISQSTGKVSTW